MSIERRLNYFKAFVKFIEKTDDTTKAERMICSSLRVRDDPGPKQQHRKR